MNPNEHSQALLRLTADIISAHVKNNQVGTADLPRVIEQVYMALRHAGQPTAPPPQAAVAAEPERPAPVVAIKKSVFPDYIICLEDGRKMKTLKRHLRSTYNLTPEQYREKWGLAPDYPMVAPNYAEHRSALAKQTGLGRKPAAPAEAKMPSVTPSTPPVAHVIEPLAEPVRERRPDLSAATVFANFIRPPEESDEEAEGQGATESAERKPRRKPFSKQLARSMRR